MRCTRQGAQVNASVRPLLDRKAARLSTFLYLVATFLAIRWFLLWLRGPQPAFPPLQIAEDDPLMQAAVSKAQATLGTFRALHALPHKAARLKIPFITSSGVRELLWAEITRLEENEAEVLYLTPPVTHTGEVERVHIHPLSDAVDWQVELEDETYRGGFTMGVMFIRGREQWGSLPKEIEAEERRYVHEA